MFFRRYCSNGAGAAALAALVLVSSARSLYAQPIRSEFEAVDRIVAIGDVHGAYDTFVENLKATGLVDDALDWIGGKTHLVQTGDVLDRGPDSRKAIDLLMKLEPQAGAAGGRVHALIGNHEFFNAVGALDYLSDAEAAQVGGLGIAPGANIGDRIHFFEPTHGTAPKYTGKDMVNPSSLILSAVMMLGYMGWEKAAALIVKGLEGAIKRKTVTYDFHRQMTGAKKVSCSEFGKAIVRSM